MMLQQFFDQNPKIAVAFSGGVDSSYLLYAAVNLGADVKPYYVKTQFQPAFELADAERMAAFLNLRLNILEADVLAEGTIAANRPDRCYRCKKFILTALIKQAKADGYGVFIDGTNASDDAADRPGMRAAAELSVQSPLVSAGITKDELRRLSKEAGLFTWNKPAYSCLATRIPHGRAITADTLHKIEAAEGVLFTLGFSDFRVRVIDNGASAKLQIPRGQLQAAVDKRDEILSALKPHFADCLLDLKGR
jgi:uncharacterized protein